MASQYEYFDPEGDGQYYIFGVNWYAQMFTVGNVGTNVDQIAYSVKLKLIKFGSPTATLTASIRAVDGDNKPTGSDLCFATKVSSTLTTTPTWYELVFTTGALLRASTQYAVIVKCPSAVDGNMPGWRGLTAGGYAGGQRANSSDSGSSWSLLSGDFLFEVWSDLSGSGGSGAIYPVNEFSS